MLKVFHRVIQCMRSKGHAVCAMPKGHDGPCGFDRPECKEADRADARRDAYHLRLDQMAEHYGPFKGIEPTRANAQRN